MTKLSKQKSKKCRVDQHKPSTYTSKVEKESKELEKKLGIQILQVQRVFARTFDYTSHRCCRHHYEVNRRTAMPSISSGLGFYRIRRPWWMWLIGFSEIITVIAVAYAISILVLEHGDAVLQGRELYMFVLQLFTCLLQVSMGTGLIWGLFSENDFTTEFCLQGWLYSAYILLLKICHSFAVDMTKMIFAGNTFGTVIGNNFFGIVRIIVVGMVHCYLDDFRYDSCAIRERDFHRKLKTR